MTFLGRGVMTRKMDIAGQSEHQVGSVPRMSLVRKTAVDGSNGSPLQPSSWQTARVFIFVISNLKGDRDTEEKPF